MFRRAYKFGRHDRIVIDGAHHRCVESDKGRHVLQLMTGFVFEDHYVPIDDDEITELLRGPSPRMRIDEGHWTKHLSMLRMRNDTSDMLRCSKEDARDAAWKLEWVQRYHRRRRDLSKPRIGVGADQLAAFVSEERDSMDRWYLDKYGERRKPGRVFEDRERKAFDWPSASGLYKWLRIYREKKERQDSFLPNYAKCGNRDQLDPRVRQAMERAVEHWCTPLKPKISDICDRIEQELLPFNKGRPPEERLRVSAATVRKRIGEIDPFLADAGREGLDRALRRYALSAVGTMVTHPMQRIEMDDWDVDLHKLAEGSSVWKKMTSEARKRMPRVRCTVTVAIDVATRCVVGLHLYTGAPSTATARTALRSTLVDKSALAAAVGCTSTWHMYGRGEFFAFDGGPAFGAEFQASVHRCRAGTSVPDQDPRMRGTIEAFFRTLKRLCRRFAGYAFSNVVERGEYPAQEMASLTVAEFHSLLVRFIVDSYHNRQHKGLEGRSPLKTWNDLIRKEMAPELTEEQMKLAFGFRRTRKLSPSGVEFMNVPFVRGKGLQELFRAVGRSEVGIIVDPADVKSILIEVPERLKGREWCPDGTDYIQVHAPEGMFPDKVESSLDKLLLVNKQVREFVRAEAEQGREIRLEADRHFYQAGLEAMRRCGIPVYGYTEKQFNAMVDHAERKSLAATERVVHASEPKSVDEASFGTVVHRNPKTKPSAPEKNGKGKPFGGSMNTYGDDG
ncbi:hypothetical protein DYI37_12260 [Fulvimarina endophytica]|uniref:Integrase catalytic domain-containing protein n=1 Tax=Fulvimarina endophytica TaxID=2293836 RepID=A0A371X0J8_9HYPH|nr:hypothetical protein [Fulvimarina endophytica]RFC62742.1 hypothetical protein DYI37_12260 [Fulvimarina endophytica]